MQSPQHLYYAAIVIMAIAEAVSFAAYQAGAAYGLDMRAHDSRFMPAVQLIVHAAAFVIGMAVSRQLPGHVAAAIFLPMVSVDLIRLVGLISAVTWWWAIYYLALAQFLTLAAGADLHPLGRWVRARAAHIADRLEYRGLASWGREWT
jgi:hypothetical protein